MESFDFSDFSEDYNKNFTEELEERF